MRWERHGRRRSKMRQERSMGGTGSWGGTWRWGPRRCLDGNGRAVVGAWARGFHLFVDGLAEGRRESHGHRFPLAL
eukprot:1694967-Pyramimonas_sp.AAC.1